MENSHLCLARHNYHPDKLRLRIPSQDKLLLDSSIMAISVLNNYRKAK